MTRLLYYLVIKPFSLLPLSVTHRIAPLISFVIFNLKGYRNSIIRNNLALSFPGKSPEERKTIAKKFYRHFGDIVVESLRTFSISYDEAHRRCKYRNPEILQEFFKEGRDIAMVGGHINNWELFAVTIDSQSDYRSVGLYRPIRNPFLNYKMQQSRSRFGLEMVNVNDRHKVMKDTSKPKIIVFGADQSPKNAKSAYWMNFLNQDTPVAYGAEKYAKEYNMAVIFGKIEKIRRGYYEVEFELIESEPTGTTYGAITEAFTRKIEAQIQNTPHQWLWTHRRWKRKRIQ